MYREGLSNFLFDFLFDNIFEINRLSIAIMAYGINFDLLIKFFRYLDEFDGNQFPNTSDPKKIIDCLAGIFTAIEWWRNALGFLIKSSNSSLFIFVSLFLQYFQPF